jgi:NAD(P)-dependent dehydrogenase (short-subunit alcohol dehydrogenase family)
LNAWAATETRVEVGESVQPLLDGVRVGLVGQWGTDPGELHTGLRQQEAQCRVCLRPVGYAWRMTCAQVVVVTGASAGLGRAVAREFAGKGARIALVARGTAGLEGAAREVERVGGRALVLPVDVADHTQVEAAAQRAEEELGPIDVWVNCAFAGVFAPFWEVTPDEYRRATEVTYFGVVNGTRTALARMRQRNRGVIVQAGSALAYRGIPLQSAYCGAKHAIQGFTESVRCELMHEHSGVRVTMVQLPTLNTPQFDWVLSRLPRRAQPVPPIYQPEVGAAAVVKAAERPGRREFWIGGSTVVTLLANKVAAGLMDRYLARKVIKAQQTGEPENSARPHNLWEPLDADHDHGAHGRFDAQAKPRRGPHLVGKALRGKIEHAASALRTH